MIYPDINSEDFYKNINKIYKKFKIPNEHRTYNDICKPDFYKLQLPQQFVSNFINPKTPYKGIIVYHQIGSGKTCTAIQIAEKWKYDRKIIVVLPAALHDNFKNEIRSECTGEEYITNDERNILNKMNNNSDEYIKILEKCNKKINKIYNIYSYNKFIELAKNREILLNNTLLIIDEIHNMVSEIGVYYSELYNLIYNSPNSLRIVLLTATPMIDKPSEIALTLNLLKLRKQVPTGSSFEKTFIEKKGENDFIIKNQDIFKNMIKGYISYYKGAPSFTFPKMKINYVYCKMMNFQYNIYKYVLKHDSNYNYVSRSLINLPNDFYIGSRIVSTIVFPNGKSGKDGANSLTNYQIKNNLGKFSAKFNKLIKNIKKADGKIFIYSSFKSYGGIKSIIRILEVFGYVNFENNEHKDNKVFAVWSGDQNENTRINIKEMFNSKNNIKGKYIKILIGSPSIKEGVSLFAVNQVHIIEPSWNRSRLMQIIGRANRFCSHKDLPANQRIVNVFIYIAVHENIIESIDEYIVRLAEKKNNLINKFEKLIKEAAVDCYLNSSTNDYNIKCNN